MQPLHAHACHVPQLDNYYKTSGWISLIFGVWLHLDLAICTWLMIISLMANIKKNCMDYFYIWDVCISVSW